MISVKFSLFKPLITNNYTLNISESRQQASKKLFYHSISPNSADFYLYMNYFEGESESVSNSPKKQGERTHSHALNKVELVKLYRLSGLWSMMHPNLGKLKYERVFTIVNLDQFREICTHGWRGLKHSLIFSSNIGENYS